MNDIFAPYETLYESDTKQYGNINLANNRAKMLEELPQGEGFMKLPFYCYAYDSIFSQATHLNVPSYSEGEAIIRGTNVDYGDWVKHYVSFYPNMMVQNCLGDTDRISNDNYNNNIGAFKPLDIDFTKVRLGMRYNLMHKGNKQSVDVQSTKDLLENYNTGDYVVRETQCNIMYLVTDGMYSYNSSGISDISVNFNVGDQWVFGNHPTEYSQHGLQLVPQWWLRLRTYGAEAYSPFHDADTGYLFQGMGIEELKLSTQDDFYDLGTGCLLYLANKWNDGVEYKPVLTVEQCLKEVAFLGLAVCDFENPTGNLYMGYINSDGLATGELIPYADWDKSDSLNIVNTVMSDYNEDITVKPKPVPEGEDDIEPVKFGFAPSIGGLGDIFQLTPNQWGSFIGWLKSARHTETDISGSIYFARQVPFNAVNTFNLEKNPSDVEILLNGAHTGVNATLITGQRNTHVSYSFEIPRIHNNFLDLSPYSVYELLFPFTSASLVLPDWCLDKTITVNLLFDVMTGSCKWLVCANGESVGSITGKFCIDIALSFENTYSKENAQINSALSLASNTAGLVSSSVLGNLAGFGYNALNTLSTAIQASRIDNANYYTTVGSSSDCSDIFTSNSIHLKITHVKSAEDSSYPHCNGRPLLKTMELSTLTGYTECVNVDTSGINCTNEEREMIKSLLETGVYL